MCVKAEYSPIVLLCFLLLSLLTVPHWLLPIIRRPAVFNKRISALRSLLKSRGLRLFRVRSLDFPPPTTEVLYVASEYACAGSSP